MEANKLIVSTYFNENYEKICPILEMLGFKAQLDAENINIYDLNNKFIGTTMRIANIFGGTTFEVDTYKGKLSIYFEASKNRNDRTITRNVVKLSDLKQIDEASKMFTGRHIEVELGMGEIFHHDIPRLEVMIIDPNAENIHTKFHINSYSIDASLQDDFGPYGNYIDGTHRSIRYEEGRRDPSLVRKTFTSYESVCKGDANYITVRPSYGDEKIPEDMLIFETTSFKNGERGTHPIYEAVMERQGTSIARQLVTSSRTISLLDYVINSIDITLPGISSYITKNFNLISGLKFLVDTNNLGVGVSSEIEKIIEDCRIPECDLPSEKVKSL